MTTPKHPHRRHTKATAGRLGGQVRSPAKATAARKNGQRGGRPTKRIPRPPFLIDVAGMVMDLRGEHRAFARGATALARWVLA